MLIRAERVTISPGKRIARYSASAMLSSVGVPMKLVNGVVNAAPYAPAVVVLATGGPASIASSVSFIALSQLTDCILVLNRTSVV